MDRFDELKAEMLGLMTRRAEIDRRLAELADAGQASGPEGLCLLADREEVELDLNGRIDEAIRWLEDQAEGHGGEEGA